MTQEGLLKEAQQSQGTTNVEKIADQIQEVKNLVFGQSKPSVSKKEENDFFTPPSS